ncbi:hypothetical protein FRB96_001061 [Tulasnella sp. 330]|nr:hypothetical protein FRB96_001061 [Tulasnella sp. 330]KAG8876447.1 hypothetical protein FRB98_007277 [Tulasnella sp. 332]
MSTSVVPTTSSGLFYAYAKNINDDFSWRYVITFASRDVADTWYRLVTDSVKSGVQIFAAVKRVSPQFYTHNPLFGIIAETLNQPNVALSLRGQMFFTLIVNKDVGLFQSVIPVLNYRDRVNGGSFYIRSTALPDVYWYYDTLREIVVASRERLTRFTITIADKSQAPSSIIIGSDDVYITTASGVNVGVDNSQDHLGKSANRFPFKFSSFSSDFQIDFDDTNGTAACLGPIAQNPDNGGSWEIV